MQTDDAMDTITALNGREVDITTEISRLIRVGRYYRAADDLDPRDRKFLHRFGWGLIQVCGPAAPLDLVDDMLGEEEISGDVPRNPARSLNMGSNTSQIAVKCDNVGMQQLQHERAWQRRNHSAEPTLLRNVTPTPSGNRTTPAASRALVIFCTVSTDAFGTGVLPVSRR